MTWQDMQENKVFNLTFFISCHVMIHNCQDKRLSFSEIVRNV